MKRLRLLLLDANIIIRLFELDLWRDVVNKCEIVIARTVAEECQYHERDGVKELIELGADVCIVEVDTGEMEAFYGRFTPDYVERLDPGEAESLAYLLRDPENHFLCSSDGIVFRCLALLGYADRGLSLEDLLSRIGLGRKVTAPFTSSDSARWLRMGREHKLRGVGLRKL